MTSQDPDGLTRRHGRCSESVSAWIVILGSIGEVVWMSACEFVFMSQEYGVCYFLTASDAAGRTAIIDDAVVVGEHGVDPPTIWHQ